MLINRVKLIFFSFILCIFMGFSSYADEKTDYDIDFNLTYFYGDEIKLERFLPIDVNIKSSKNEKLKLVFEIFSRDTEIQEHINEIDVNFIFNKKYTLFLDKGSFLVKVYLKNAKDKILKEKEIDISKYNKTSSFLIGILSDEPKKLAYFDNLSLNYGLLKSKLIFLEREAFPTDSRELEQLDAILVSSYRMRDLGYEQSMALMNFVKNGGILILGTGKRVAHTIGRYAPELLDEMYEAPFKKTLEIKISDNEKIEKEIEIVNLNIHGGNTIISYEGIPLISTLNKEKGKIIVAGYDFTDFSELFSKNNEYISEIFTKALGFRDLEEFTSNKKYLKKDVLIYLDQILSMPRLKKIPNLNIYLFILLTYLVFSYPLIFILLKKLGLNHLYNKSLVLSSLLFTLIIYFISGDIRYRDSFYRYFSVNTVGEDDIISNSFLKITNPYNKAYKLEMDKDYIYRSLAKDFIYDKEKKDRVKIEHKKDKTFIEYLKNKSFESHIINLEKKIENTEKIGLETDIRVFKDEISGYIINNYKFDLEDVYIFMYSKMFYIKDIKQGEKISLEKEKMLNIPLVDYFLSASYYENKNQLLKSEKYYEEAYIENFEKLNIIEFYMKDFFTSYSQDAKILAFSKEENELDILKEIEKDGRSLFVSNISVDNVKDEKIYRQALLKEPSVILGEYYYENNSFDTDSPLILEYKLGNDINIEELNFEYFNEDIEDIVGIKNFEKDIFIYNKYTRNFEKKDISKNSFSYEEIEKYLLEENILRLRYVSPALELHEYKNVSLPIISVIASRK